MTEPLNLYRYATATTGGADHQREFWDALERSLTPEQRASYQEKGPLRVLWQAPAVARPITDAAVAALRQLLQIIYAGEAGSGGYDAFNKGKAGATPGPYLGTPGGLTSLTVGQVIELQAAEKVFAVGAPQIIPSTMPLAMKASGVTAGERFNAATQDRLAAGLILGRKRPNLASYLLGKGASLDAAQTDLAYEWASLPLPNGKGVYDGDKGGNRATAKVAEVRAALADARKRLTPGAGKAARVTSWKASLIALNLSQPDASTCQAACIAMAVRDKDILSVRRKLLAKGIAGDPAVMGRVARDYGANYTYEGDASLDDVFGWLKAGEFLITHGWFTGSGHVICLDGLKVDPKSGRYSIDVKDPWSEFDGPSWSYNGTAKFFDGFYSELIIYAACVASASVASARAAYRAGAVDRKRGGMWVHRFRS